MTTITIFTYLFINLYGISTTKLEFTKWDQFKSSYGSVSKKLVCLPSLDWGAGWACSIRPVWHKEDPQKCTTKWPALNAIIRQIKHIRSFAWLSFVMVRNCESISLHYITLHYDPPACTTYALACNRCLTNSTYSWWIENESPGQMSQTENWNDDIAIAITITLVITWVIIAIIITIAGTIRIAMTIAMNFYYNSNYSYNYSSSLASYNYEL